MPKKGVAGANVGDVFDRLHRHPQQPPSPTFRANEHLVRAVQRALAQVPGSGEFVFERRDAVHLPGLRAALWLPLPQASLRAQWPRCHSGGRAALPGQGGQAAA